MPEILHHDAELTDLLRIGTRRKVFSRVRVRQGNYMKSHAEILSESYENIVGMLIRTTTPRSQIATENIAR